MTPAAPWLKHGFLNLMVYDETVTGKALTRRLACGECIPHERPDFQWWHMPAHI